MFALYTYIYSIDYSCRTVVQGHLSRSIPTGVRNSLESHQGATKLIEHANHHGCTSVEFSISSLSPFEALWHLEANLTHEPIKSPWLSPWGFISFKRTSSCLPWRHVKGLHPAGRRRVLKKKNIHTQMLYMWYMLYNIDMIYADICTLGRFRGVNVGIYNIYIYIYTYSY